MEVNDPEERRFGNAQLVSQICVGPRATDAFQEIGERRVEAGHSWKIARNTFRMGNLFPIGNIDHLTPLQAFSKPEDF